MKSIIRKNSDVEKVRKRKREMEKIRDGESQKTEDIGMRKGVEIRKLFFFFHVLRLRRLISFYFMSFALRAHKGTSAQSSLWFPFDKLTKSIGPWTKRGSTERRDKDGNVQLKISTSASELSEITLASMADGADIFLCCFLKPLRKYFLKRYVAKWESSRDVNYIWK